eukprot:Rhum_TRINITY_DN8582_c0_g1::Rhum_TRINITY_DN8582_c0_g1_i1::g.28794::m.28794/K14618/MMACHC; methylmalonic aciduria homocystinuria type C protein
MRVDLQSWMCATATPMLYTPPPPHALSHFPRTTILETLPSLSFPFPCHKPSNKNPPTMFTRRVTAGAGTHLMAASPPFAELEAQARAAGFDVWQPFAAEWYNAEVDGLTEEQRKALLRLPTLPEAATQADDGVAGTAAFVVGNSKALWPKFIEHLRAKGARTAADVSDDPLDAYVKELIHGVARRVLGDSGVRYDCFYSAWTPDKQVVSLQRAAALSGLAYLDNSTHLCVHPEFGAWFGLRVVLVVQAPIVLARPTPMRRLVTDAEEAEARRRMEHALEVGKWGAKATETTSSSSAWELWVGVRDVVSHGKEHRYAPTQLEYHYTKNAALLLRDVNCS